MVIFGILTYMETWYYLKLGTHDCKFYQCINVIEHTKNFGRHPQINGIYNRFHNTIFKNFLVLIRMIIYLSL